MKVILQSGVNVMLSDFMNGLEDFKKEIAQMSDEEFLAPFLELGIEFVPITEEKSANINSKTLQGKVVYTIPVENKDGYPMQLIA